MQWVVVMCGWEKKLTGWGLVSACTYQLVPPPLDWDEVGQGGDLTVLKITQPGSH